jgi:hypothetical protein
MHMTSMQQLSGPGTTISASRPAEELSRFKAAPEQRRPTMDDFWIQQGWYRKRSDGTIKLRAAKWKDNPHVRREAVRFLAEKVLKKDPRDITHDDFNLNRLGGLLGNYYESSPYDAFRDAGYVFHPWEMSYTPLNFYDIKANRIDALNWLVEKLGKDPRDITTRNFRSKRLGGLLNMHYRDSPYYALKEAGYKINPWEMLTTPDGFYNLKETRISAVRWLVRKLGKEPRDMTSDDFHSNRLGGLLGNHYGDSPYEAVLEAGLVSRKDEAHMRRHVPK